MGAAATGTFSVLHAGSELLFTGAGGALVGLAVGLAVLRLRARLDDAPIEISLSLFTPFAAYIAAEALGLSGILANDRWMMPARLSGTCPAYEEEPG